MRKRSGIIVPITSSGGTVYAVEILESDGDYLVEAMTTDGSDVLELRVPIADADLRTVGLALVSYQREILARWHSLDLVFRDVDPADIQARTVLATLPCGE